MPTRPPRPCTTPRCGDPAEPGSSKCKTHRSAARAQSDRRRGDATQRGYGREHRERFRKAVLSRDPWCVMGCGRPSTVADHWPMSRRELVAAGLDPNDKQHGRGLCASCHGKETAANPNQRGGWNRRTPR